MLDSIEIKKDGSLVIYIAHGLYFTKMHLKNRLIYCTIEKQFSPLMDCLITVNPEDYNNVKNKYFESKDTKMIQKKILRKNLVQEIHFSLLLTKQKNNIPQMNIIYKKYLEAPISSNLSVNNHPQV